MTKSQRMRLSAVMISSTIPSAKYSCSGSPLILAKGNTAMDGLSGSGSAGGAGVGALLAAANPVDAHSPRDIFDLLLAQILKGEIELVAHLIAHDAADADPTRRRQRLQTRRDIHSVAVNVLTLNNNVTEIDPY